MRTFKKRQRIGGVTSRRRGIASIIGTIIFVLVLMVAIGAQTYVQGLQAQSNQIADSAQQLVERRSAEVLVYSGSGAGSLAITNYGLSASVITAVFLKYPNGTVFRMPVATDVQLPLGTSTGALQSVIPTQTCGSTTCLADYGAVANGLGPTGSLIGVGTSYGNTFWYGPFESIVNWSNLSDLPPGCAANQYVTAVGSTVTCSQVGWGQLTGYPSPCASNQYVSAYGATLTCSPISLSWAQLTGFPPACPVGQFISALGATPACGAAGSLTSRVASAVTTTSYTTYVSTTLSVSIAANTNYLFTAQLGAGTTSSVGSVMNVVLHALPSGASVVFFCMWIPGGDTCVVPLTSNALSIGGESAYQVVGLVTGGATGGTLQLDFRVDPGSAGSNAIIKAGSFMTAQPVQ